MRSTRSARGTWGCESIRFVALRVGDLHGIRLHVRDSIDSRDDTVYSSSDDHPLILAPWAAARPEAQGPTRAWLAGQRDVQRVHCERSTDYADALLAAWAGPDRDLIVIEHDIVPRGGVVAEFAACTWPFCTSPYVLSGGAVSLLHPGTRITLGGSPADYQGRYLRAISCLGCVRFRRDARALIDTSTFAGVFDGLDVRVSLALIAARSVWHVHRPVLAHTGRP